MKRLKAQAILLDMDGTLVKSTSEIEKIWSYWCDRHQLSLQQILSICHGVRSKDIISQVAPHLNAEAEVASLNSLEIEHTSTGNAILGADKFIQTLLPHRWAVVTSCNKHVAVHRMQLSNLTLPELLIGSEDVVNGKPHPEPYQLAAFKLGVLPTDCIVFEDAIAGIQSALSCGCRVVQVGGATALSDKVEAVIQNWNQVSLSSTARPGELEVVVNY